MKKAYEDHESFTAIKNPHKDNIRQDIYTLQLSESNEIFDSAYGLFKKKWNKVHSSVDEFLIYFDKVWICQHPGWYEGFVLGVPSTNNRSESNNGQIKEQATYRVKLPLGHFLEVVQRDIVEKWSKERNATNPYCKKFEEIPPINHSLWVETYQISVDDRLTTAIKTQSVSTTYMSSGRLNEHNEPIIDKKNITRETKIYKEHKQKKNWTSFDH
jgi:hypothetical protein